MKKHRKHLYLITVILVVIMVMMCQKENINQSIPVSLVVCAANQREVIDLWEDEQGVYYAFLPSYAGLSQVSVSLVSNKPVYVNDLKLTEGMKCSEFELGVPYTLSYFAGPDKCHTEIVFLQSSSVPTIYIETQSGTMDHIHVEKGNGESGRITIYDPNGTIHYTGVIETIQGRGNNSWIAYEKKPYNINLYEAVDLYSMGTAKKWALLANAGDPTNLRNKIVHEFAVELGMPYVSESQWVDLYLNGEYAGLYQLSETNEVSAERVHIANEGSFLVSLEILSKLEEQNIASISTDRMQTFRLRYPESYDLNMENRIKDTLQKVENAILTEDGVDPVSGKHWKDLIDVDSWVRKYLIEEVFANGDAGSISQFFYVDGGDPSGKLYAGPVWDYDRAMGNSIAWQLMRPQTFYANRIHVSPGYDTPWLYMLCQNEDFFEQVRRVYQKEFVPLLKELLQEEIYTYKSQIEQASILNQTRWYTEENDLDMEIESVIRYINDRMTFLDEVWIEERPYYRVLADHALGGNYANYIVFEGECLSDLPVFEDTETAECLGWYYTATDEPFDSGKPITEDTEIYVKWRSKSVEYQPVGAYEQWLGRIQKLAPLAAFALILLLLFLVDVKRWKFYN